MEKYITDYIYIPVTFNCVGIGDLNMGTGEKILTSTGFMWFQHKKNCLCVCAHWF